ncbi:MAG: aromatic aminobenezylarsenical efflux permease ArsG family transporter, partial [Candidatus Gracilibacteria bacterium]|nr:aromatic aminobenezylarsenical efflux permease ArsG family transporter [Candidatus Gracilibacteria bacterium]
MDFINAIIDNYNIPLLSAFLLGIITSISPCPLATNITAISYISKNLHSTKKTMIHSLVYTLGRVFTYTLIIFLIWGGLSTFKISSLFQGYGDKILGPILIFVGLVMLNIIKLPKIGGSERIQKFKESLDKKGYFGTFLLGILFALAFCPYSGVMFFGVLIPIVMNSSFPL